MDNVTQAFFSLLRCGLWGREPENPEIFDMDAAGWEKIYSESRRQTVTGIVYDGLSRIPEPSPKSNPNSSLPVTAMVVPYTTIES